MSYSKQQIKEQMKEGNEPKENESVLAEPVVAATRGSELLKRRATFEKLTKEPADAAYGKVTFNTNVDNYKEVEQLFKLADELQDKCSDQYRRIDKMQWVFEFIIATMGFLIGLFLIEPISVDFIKQTEATAGKVILLMVAYLMVFVAAALRQIKKAKEKIKAEELALSAVLELIRETEGLIAKENNVSPLQRASFRIRVSKYSTRYSSS